MNKGKIEIELSMNASPIILYLSQKRTEQNSVPFPYLCLFFS